MNTRERFVKFFTRTKGIRPPFQHVFGPLPETLERWKTEGMKHDDDWFYEAGFEGNPHRQYGNMFPVNGFICPEFEERIIGDDGETRIVNSKWGETKKVLVKGESLPYTLNSPVRDFKTWHPIKERLEFDSDQRFPSGWDNICKSFEDDDIPSFIGGLPCGFYGASRELFGVENLSLAFYDNPELVNDVLDTLCELWCRLYQHVAARTKIDFVFIWEDMCFKNGPLISPAIFREFLLPRYKRLTSAVRDAGIDIIFVDSDGDVTELLGLYAEGGGTAVLPFEIQSGVDVETASRSFPDLFLLGGIEKSLPSKDHVIIERELERISRLLEKGRYFPHADHTTPPNVSYEQYVSFYRKLGELVRNSGE